MAEEFADSFEFEEEEVDGGDVQKEVKVTAPLTKEQADVGYEAYQNYVTAFQPIRMGLDPSKKYGFNEIWEQMAETDRKTINKMFKKKGKFGQSGGGTSEVARSAAHQRAINLKREVTQAMYGYAEKNFSQQLNELQNLNNSNEVSFEIYVKGWKKFVDGLPTE